MRRIAGCAVLFALLGAACVPAQTHTAAVRHHHHAKKKAAQATTTVEVINGKSMHTQTFPAAASAQKGKSAEAGSGSSNNSVRVLNGTRWSTETFPPQPAPKSARAEPGVTRVSILNGTQAETKVFNGGVPQAHAGAAPPSGQPVVVAIESSDGKKRVVAGKVGSEPAGAAKVIPPTTPHPKRPPYHPNPAKTH